MTTTGKRGDAPDVMVQGMTPPAQCVTGQVTALSPMAIGCWPDEFGPATLICPLDSGKGQKNRGVVCDLFKPDIAQGMRAAGEAVLARISHRDRRRPMTQCLSRDSYVFNDFSSMCE